MKEGCLNRSEGVKSLNKALKDVNCLNLTSLEAIRSIISMWVDRLYQPFLGSLKSKMSIE